MGRHTGFSAQLQLECHWAEESSCSNSCTDNYPNRLFVGSTVDFKTLTWLVVSFQKALYGLTRGPLILIAATSHLIDQTKQGKNGINLTFSASLDEMTRHWSHLAVPTLGNSLLLEIRLTFLTEIFNLFHLTAQLIDAFMLIQSSSIYERMACHSNDCTVQRLKQNNVSVASPSQCLNERMQTGVKEEKKQRIALVPSQLKPLKQYNHNAMLHYVMLHYAMLCYAMLCYATLRYATLRYATLCYAMLCHAMLCILSVRFVSHGYIFLFIGVYNEMVSSSIFQCKNGDAKYGDSHLRGNLPFTIITMPIKKMLALAILSLAGTLGLGDKESRTIEQVLCFLDHYVATLEQ
ncbi:hypothetical protein L345_02982, partial [Ophiophagus hannah]